MPWLKWLLAGVLCSVASLFGTAPATARSVFVNGVDVSSARSQLMENVTVRIDGDGNVFIEAPTSTTRLPAPEIDEPPPNVIFDVTVQVVAKVPESQIDA